MKNSINNAFKIAKKENRSALISYTVCGDNTKNKSLEILNSISKNLDIAEWGIPHNCPTADGIKECQRNRPHNYHPIYCHYDTTNNKAYAMSVFISYKNIRRL